jgi:hypothetical protein
VPGDFAPWQSATGFGKAQAEAAVWFAEALVEWQKRQLARLKKKQPV